MESYDICIFGELDLPPGQSGAWRALRLDGRLFTDWPDAFRWRSDEAEVSVGRWLDDASVFGSGGGHERFFDVDQAVDANGTERWRVRARLGDTEYEAYRRPIATLFRLAGAVGGRGRLFFMSDPSNAFPFGYRVSVDPSFSAFSALDDEGVQEAASVIEPHC